MNQFVPLAVIGSIALLTIPASAQGRFGNEAKERAADRIEREAIRRAEHPELDRMAAGKSAETPVQNATPAAEPARAAEPVPAADPTSAQ